MLISQVYYWGWPRKTKEKEGALEEGVKCNSLGTIMGLIRECSLLLGRGPCNITLTVFLDFILMSHPPRPFFLNGSIYLNYFGSLSVLYVECVSVWCRIMSRHLTSGSTWRLPWDPGVFAWCHVWMRISGCLLSS